MGIEVINAQDVQTGDILLVNEGDQVPVDGEVLSGDALVNEAMITGESIPVSKTKYDTVIGGTIVAAGQYPYYGYQSRSATGTGANNRFDEKSPGCQATRYKNWAIR
jgi:P-type E1-E2 ATPase